MLAPGAVAVRDRCRELVISTPLRALLGAAVLNLCGGSLYALSVLLRALEDAALVDRAQGSLGFSVATGAFLIGVLSAPALLIRLSVARHVIMAGSAGASALALASISLDAPLVLAACALVYGGACGQFYSIALSAVRRSGASKLGLAAGAVVACFALGSAGWSYLTAHLVGSAGLAVTFGVKAAIFAATAISAALLLATLSGADDVAIAASDRAQDHRRGSALTVLWIGFFAMAAAGLAVISQAAQIARATPAISAALLTALVGLANGGGRLAGGTLADRMSARRLTGALAAVTTGTLALAVIADGVMLAALTVVIALLYGAASAIYPAVLMKQTAVATFPRRFAQLFTAWGVAAIAAPPLAGWQSQSSGEYDLAFGLLAALNAVAVVFLIRSPRVRTA
jgi:MFS transporter, OFA family, oxalate/formate antiporter